MRHTSRVRAVVTSSFALAVLVSIVFPTVAQAQVPTSPDSTWGTDGRVEAIVRIGNTIFVGGAFANVVDPSGNSYPRSNLAAIDAFTGEATAWSPNANSTVFSLALSPDGSTLYAGGNFTQIGTSTRSRIAAFNVASGALSSWKPKSFNGMIRAVAPTASSIYVGGDFTTMGGVARTRLAAIDPSTALLQSWNPTASALVRAILVTPTRVYVAGNFSTINSVTQRNLAAVDPGSGASITCSCHPGVPVLDLATDGTRLFAAAGGAGGTAFAYNLTSGNLLWSVKGDGNVQAVGVFGSFVYVGGHFLTIAKKPMDQLVRLDLATGALDASWRPVVTDHNPNALGVFTISSFSSKLYVGGDFDRITSTPQPHFAQFTDSGVQNTADTGLTMTDTPDPIPLGQNLTYSLTATNAGPDGATGVTIVHQLVAGASFVSASSGCNFDTISSRVTCSLGNLAPSGSAVATVTVRVEQAGSLSNTATISSNENDPQPANNSATATTQVQDVAGTSDVAVVQTASANPIGTGQSLTYHVVASNAGPDTADNLTVTDTIPSTAQFVSATPSQGSCSGTATIDCSIGTLTSGAQASVDVVVTTPSAPMTLTNSAHIGGPNLLDLDMSDNDTSLMTTVITSGTGDTTAPQRVNSQMFDADADGLIDRVVVNFNEPLATCVAPCTAGWSLNGVPSDGSLSSVTTSGSQAILSIAEGASAPNTAVDLFTVGLLPQNAIQDAAGNHASFAAAAPQDKAGPVPVAFRKGSSGPTSGLLEPDDTITVEWSENIAPATVPAGTTVTLSDPSGPGQDTLYVTGLFGSVMNTGSDGFLSLDGGVASFASSTLYLETPDTTTAKVAGACSGTGCGALVRGPSTTVVYVASASLTDAAGNAATGTFTKSMRLF